MDELRGERRESREGNRTIIREPDRTIIREGQSDHYSPQRGRTASRYGAQDVAWNGAATTMSPSWCVPGRRSCRHVVDENGILAAPLAH